MKGHRGWTHTNAFKVSVTLYTTLPLATDSSYIFQWLYTWVCDHIYNPTEHSAALIFEFYWQWSIKNSLLPETVSVLSYFKTPDCNLGSWLLRANSGGCIQSERCFWKDLYLPDPLLTGIQLVSEQLLKTCCTNIYNWSRCVHVWRCL